MDELLHLLAPRAVLEVAAQGYAVACCGVLLVTENRWSRWAASPTPAPPGGGGCER